MMRLILPWLSVIVGCAGTNTLHHDGPNVYEFQNEVVVDGSFDDDGMVFWKA